MILKEVYKNLKTGISIFWAVDYGHRAADFSPTNALSVVTDRRIETIQYDLVN
jgi:hypothetical protein